MNAPLPVVPTRGDRQRQIEDLLESFGPDAVEAQELALALVAGMEKRYDQSQLADVLHELKQLLEAMDELDKTTCSNSTEIDPIDAYKDHRAREAGL